MEVSTSDKDAIDLLKDQFYGRGREMRTYDSRKLDSADVIAVYWASTTRSRG